MSAVLEVVLPSLWLVSAGMTVSVTVTVLALALSVLVVVVLLARTPGSRTGPVPAPTDHTSGPLLSGRATDPLHHPLRPRAPGQA